MMTRVLGIMESYRVDRDAPIPPMLAPSSSYILQKSAPHPYPPHHSPCLRSDFLRTEPVARGGREAPGVGQLIPSAQPALGVSLPPRTPGLVPGGAVGGVRVGGANAMGAPCRNPQGRVLCTLASPDLIRGFAGGGMGAQRDSIFSEGRC